MKSNALSNIKYQNQKYQKTPVGAYHFVLQIAAELHDSVCQNPVVAAQEGIRPSAIEVRVLRFRLGDGGFVIQFDNSQ